MPLLALTSDGNTFFHFQNWWSNIKLPNPLRRLSDEDSISQDQSVSFYQHFELKAAEFSLAQMKLAKKCAYAGKKLEYIALVHYLY